jgi:hypothetical protein
LAKVFVQGKSSGTDGMIAIFQRFFQLFAPKMAVLKKGVIIYFFL